MTPFSLAEPFDNVYDCTLGGPEQINSIHIAPFPGFLYYILRLICFFSAPAWPQRLMLCRTTGWLSVREELSRLERFAAGWAVAFINHTMTEPGYVWSLGGRRFQVAFVKRDVEDIGEVTKRGRFAWVSYGINEARLVVTTVYHQVQAEATVGDLRGRSQSLAGCSRRGCRGTGAIRRTPC
jgi:hypothetical protein